MSAKVFRIEIRDLFDEMKDENNRLLAQIDFLNKCFLLFEKYRNYLKVLSNNCKCDQNIENEVLFNNLENEYKSLVINDNNLIEDKNLVSIQNSINIRNNNKKSRKKSLKNTTNLNKNKSLKTNQNLGSIDESIDRNVIIGRNKNCLKMTKKIRVSTKEELIKFENMGQNKYILGINERNNYLRNKQIFNRQVFCRSI
jgi:hypothetical protein